MIGLSLPSGPLTVLCVGAHPDDVEIGCGGTVLRLAERGGVTLHVATLTGSEERRREGAAAAQAFHPGAVSHTWDFPDGRLPAHWDAVKDALEGLARTVRPDVVLAPRTDDAHQDHRLLGTLVPTTWRDALVLGYEIVKWDGDLGTATTYVPLDERVARRKVELLHAAYPSQHGHDWWDDETFLGMMRVRGVECRARYAEAFVVRKATVDLGEGS